MNIKEIYKQKHIVVSHHLKALACDGDVEFNTYSHKK